MRRRAFTLIELLVVVSIIALLIALLIPALTKAREEAKLTKCAANLHALGLAMASYNGQNNDLMPHGAYTCTAATYAQEWHNPPSYTLLSSFDVLRYEGCFTGNGNWKGTINNNNSYHYPTAGYGLMQCPSHAAEFQWGNDSRYEQGYGIAWAVKSCFYPDQWNPKLLVRARELNSQHVMIMESSPTSCGASAYYVPAHMDQTTSPGYKIYGMYERHRRNSTRGANYLMAGGHVEYSQLYGWARSSFRFDWDWPAYIGPANFPNGKPNTAKNNPIWTHGVSNR